MGEPENMAGHDERRALMGVLAVSGSGRIAELCRDAGLDLAHERVRGPESGLVTLRGRIGGGGSAFNVGECTVTRASVRLPGGEVGHAYALGRDGGKVGMMAVLDALWQRQESRDAVRDGVLSPLMDERAEADRRRTGETAATKVDFFTLVRGEDE